MSSEPVIAILDIGKTNKKLFLFNEGYQIVGEWSQTLPEIKDEDGEPCEDIHAITSWIGSVLSAAKQNSAFDIRAINFSAYGASFVHIGWHNELVTPLYNYLKVFPPALKETFYAAYGGEEKFSMETASPVLGSLNSGMQLYRLKKESPNVFAAIKYSLHLPQYLSWLMTGNAHTDITSIGCHTNLWNFSLRQYHHWVQKEGVENKFPPLRSASEIFPVHPVAALENLSDSFTGMVAGVGLHDSSAAIIPYLESFREPFILISTGTWCISMNPFNQVPLSEKELQNDCLCYMTDRGEPMKASRLFAGHEHDKQTERLSIHFRKENSYYRTVLFDPGIFSRLSKKNRHTSTVGETSMVQASFFAQRHLTEFDNFEEAYHQLMMDIMEQQAASLRFILTDEVKRIFVDGGFSKNQVYMHLLASAFPSLEVFAASIAQASAIGAAMAIHPHWNRRPLPTDTIELRLYK